MLSLDNLSIIQNNKQLFGNLGISILPGSIICIYGRNGVGKTSLLRAVAGIGNFNGVISYNDFDIKKVLLEYQTLVSYIGHQNALDYELSVIENLEFWAKIRNMEHAIAASFSLFELTPYEEIKISQLSQGWARKVELTKLLLTQSIIWVLDEPFANLDQKGKDRLIEMIKVRAMNSGIIIFTAQSPCIQDNIINLNLEDYLDV